MKILTRIVFVIALISSGKFGYAQIEDKEVEDYITQDAFVLCKTAEQVYKNVINDLHLPEGQNFVLKRRNKKINGYIRLVTTNQYKLIDCKVLHDGSGGFMHRIFFYKDSITEYNYNLKDTSCVTDYNHFEFFKDSILWSHKEYHSWDHNNLVWVYTGSIYFDYSLKCIEKFEALSYYYDKSKLKSTHSYFMLDLKSGHKIYQDASYYTDTLNPFLTATIDTNQSERIIILRDSSDFYLAGGYPGITEKQFTMDDKKLLFDKTTTVRNPHNDVQEYKESYKKIVVENEYVYKKDRLSLKYNPLNGKGEQYDYQPDETTVYSFDKQNPEKRKIIYTIEKL